MFSSKYPDFADFVKLPLELLTANCYSFLTKTLARVDLPLPVLPISNTFLNLSTVTSSKSSKDI
ncbi:hypothetical protein C2G38_2082679 [Gigaspora rosea]|uniref:Uncharacterized protein n=1 Tax=Gigaspora rosea TaxID=44941 RepID=A0A397VB19_9GLOM|nr:hypothetical protein C2G38_2082679 [Gigaspora rosea]